MTHLAQSMGPAAGDRPPRKPRPPAAKGEGPRAAVRTVSSEDLLGPEGLLQIEHRGEIYFLRLTRNGRLILTK
jgi:hemin uptake protein HemP